MEGDIKLDLRSEKNLVGVHPFIDQQIRKVFQSYSQIYGVDLIVLEGLRSYMTQLDYFKKGRVRKDNGTWVVVDKKQVITNALPGQSLHQFGLAVDCIFPGNDPFLEKLRKQDRNHADTLWEKFGNIAKDFGFDWGGDWKMKDKPHVENKFGLQLSDFQELYNAGGLKKAWSKVDSILNCGGEIS